MKKSIFITLFLLISISVSVKSQINGVNFKEAICMDDYVVYGELGYQTQYPGVYVYVYKRTPVGILEARKKFNSILAKNGKTADDVMLSDFYLASYINSIDDYETLDMSLKRGESIICMYTIINGWITMLMLDDDSYGIVFMELKNNENRE